MLAIDKSLHALLEIMSPILWEKRHGLMTPPHTQKYGRPGNSTTYCSDTVMPYNQNTIDRRTQGCILPFPKKGDIGIAKNNRCITLTSTVTKIYNALLHNRIEPKFEEIIRKNQNGFRRNRFTMSQILTICRILENVRAIDLEATILFVDFVRAFDSIHRGKMEQMPLAYGLPKETYAAIRLQYRNMKVKVRSPDRGTDYFVIVAGVLHGDSLAPYLFIICLDYVLRTSIDKMKDNDFKLAKERSRRYPTQIITDADYADDIALLANTTTQAETMHSLERVAAGIGLNVNVHETEYMCFNKRGDISTLNGKFSETSRQDHLLKKHYYIVGGDNPFFVFLFAFLLLLMPCYRYQPICSIAK